MFNCKEMNNWRDQVVKMFVQIQDICLHVSVHDRDLNDT